MIPVSGLVGVLPPETVVIERYATSGTIDSFGTLLDPSPTLITASVVVHQATRKQLERAGLDLATDARAFYCKDQLRTVTTTKPDVIQYAGERWELYNCADYDVLGGLYMALGKRIE